LLKHILEHQDEIVNVCCLDSGKTQVDACFGEILVTAEKLQWIIKHGEKALRPSRRPTNLLMCYKKNTVRYEPLGVVAACVSWNYPFHNFISPVISALFSGNAIVVKPSEQTCWSAEYFLKIIRGALVACGQSEQLVQSVVCLPETADHLTSHPKLRHITFIGSRDVAFKVCASAAKALTPVTVELGGKDPAIVLDDAKTYRSLESVCAILLRGVFQSAGQNCVGLERVIALHGVYARIIQIVEPKIRALRLGSITVGSEVLDMGSMISERSFDRLESLIQEAVDSGATLHCGGRRWSHPDYPGGHFFQPTFISGVTKDMKIAQNELFAPIFLLMRASDNIDAVDIANSTSYGLGASVFGHLQSEVDYCVRNLQAGMVAVNDFGAYYACSLPFGGVKGSGYGRFGGAEGLQGLCSIKAVCEDAWWAKLMGLQTNIPPQLQYPIRDREIAWQMCKGVVETGYAISVRGRLEGVARLIGGMMGRKDKQS
jgi:acyl-CoA reductase-like NAD-dependent aldehyde dehydrogenase